MTMFASATTVNSVKTREAQELVRQESLEIAQGLKRQDAGLLDELIVRYQHRLLRYLLFLTSNREQAEDLFQEVWMRGLVRGAQFNGKARFDTWLFPVARNLVSDLRRKRAMSSAWAGLKLRPRGRRRVTSAPAGKTGIGWRQRSWKWSRCIARCWFCGF